MRTRLAVACAATAALALLAVYVVTWAQTSNLRERGTDFSASYVAAVLLRHGDGARLYDQHLEQSTHLAMLPPGTRITLPFVTPPTSALLALPFTALDPATAPRVFAALELALLVLAAAVALRAAPWPDRVGTGPRLAVGLVAVAAVPTMTLFLLGQFDSFCALGLAGAYAAWRRGRPGPAGFWLLLGFAALKPHLAIGLVLFLVARGERRALAGGALAAGLVAGISALLVGPAGLAAFVASPAYSLSVTPAISTVGLFGVAASWLGDGRAGIAAGLAAALLALAGCWALGRASRGGAHRLEAALAGATALSLAASPHLFTYDLVALAPALAWCMARAAAIEQPAAWPGRQSATLAAAWVAGNALVDVDVGNAAAAPPGRLSGLVLLAAGAAAWRSLGAAPARSRRSAPALLQSGSGSGAGGSVE